MRRCLTVFGLMLLLIGTGAPARTAPAAQERSISSGPTIDDLISLRRVSAPVISPDGTQVAYVVRETNWEENSYETEIWLADVRDGTNRQLTNAAKSSGAPAWAPDGRRLAFLSDRSGKHQIHTITPAGGESIQITTSGEPISAFKWSPDGLRIAFTAVDPVLDPMKERVNRYGDFDVIDDDHRMTNLQVVDIGTRQVRRLTNGQFVVGSFEWSPDGTRIAFDHRINSDPDNNGTADISIVGAADGRISRVVTRDGSDSEPKWSPDGSHVAFVTSMANPPFTYRNRVIALVPAAGGTIKSLTTTFDENPSIVEWKPSGIFFMASQRTWSYLYRLDPATERISRLAPSDRWIGSAFSLSDAAQTAALIASDPSTFPEVAVLKLDTLQQRMLTELGTQTVKWAQPVRDVVSWRSQDGTQIEGVLHKPANFEVGKAYPLLVIIHGGPTGTSRPIPFTSLPAGLSAYPLDVWLARGALVLEPNYRGSAGYGERFRSLNVRNLGIGDAWDVLSGIDHLIRQGWVDGGRVGVMGWSQGGYISAFLSTRHGARFKAISVGAGISNWATYYSNTDIHRFTRQYLLATPWDDPDVYAKTSPMTYIKGARTATLIQHGATDRRVPLSNAYELYQGLRDQGTATQLIVYKGFEGVGHGPSKPKSSRALMQHNLAWFDKYLFEAPVAEEHAVR